MRTIKAFQFLSGTKLFCYEYDAGRLKERTI